MLVMLESSPCSSVKLFAMLVMLANFVVRLDVSRVPIVLLELSLRPKAVWYVQIVLSVPTALNLAVFLVLTVPQVLMRLALVYRPALIVQPVASNLPLGKAFVNCVPLVPSRPAAVQMLARNALLELLLLFPGAHPARIVPPGSFPSPLDPEFALIALLVLSRLFLALQSAPYVIPGMCNLLLDSRLVSIVCRALAQTLTEL